MVFNPLQDHALTVRQAGHSSRILEGLADPGFLFQFVDARPVDIAADSHLGSEGRNVNHIPGQQPHVARLVAFLDQIV